ncbi:MAG TPA: hypothetical protein VGB42_00550 [Candidatus Thermoplasmatota archaeon]
MTTEATKRNDDGTARGLPETEHRYKEYGGKECVCGLTFKTPRALKYHVLKMHGNWGRSHAVYRGSRQ